MSTVKLISLGCAKNLVDSECVIGDLSAAGCPLGGNRVGRDPDYIIINTCGFIRSALDETRREIDQARLRHPGSRLVIFGCGVNRAAGELKRAFPGITDWFRIAERDRMIAMIAGRVPARKSRRITTAGFAYLKIADGCSNRCAYCTIPAIRGPLASRSMPDIIDEAAGLSRAGARELTLIAQDTAAYGRDRYGRPMLIPLVRALSRLPGIGWLRILYAHPRSLSPGMIHELAAQPKVCRYLDMPIQHISERLLRLMNRHAGRQRIETLVQALKSHGFTFRTTVMSGFPTETDAEHRELVAFIRAAEPDWLGVFSYSRESGTPADVMRPVAPRIADRRYMSLIKLQRSLLRTKNRRRIGRMFDILVSGSNGHPIGHAEFAAPEVDSRVIVTGGKALIGHICRARITSMRGSDLYAKVVPRTGHRHD